MAHGWSCPSDAHDDRVPLMPMDGRVPLMPMDDRVPLMHVIGHSCELFRDEAGGIKFCLG